MGLSDYMIAPIQRITRYGLLLKGILIYTICTVAVLKKLNFIKFFFFSYHTDLTKHSNPESADFMYMQRSLKCHLALAHAMNEVQ